VLRAAGCEARRPALRACSSCRSGGEECVSAGASLKYTVERLERSAVKILHAASETSGRRRLNIDAGRPAAWGTSWHTINAER